MRILLLQDHLYLPSLGGGIKANRLLMEGFARRGHPSAVVSPALTTRAGPTCPAEFLAEMASRRVAVQTPTPGLYTYEYQGVQVDAIDFPTVEQAHDHIRRRIRDFQPDWVFVNDDKRRLMLSSALEAASERVVLILQTIVNLPFGPLAAQACPVQTDRMQRARGILVISNYLKDYLYQHAGLNSCLLPLPVYGEGPFPALGRCDRGFITMINPCVEKGLDIFLGLARRFPDLEFAAVPTWGADAAVLHALTATPNVHILEPADDIEVILRQTRVLLVPSLWPETFGYVVPEAMARSIPVLVSDSGGLREAALGVASLLPVVPAERHGNVYISPPQNLAPWIETLTELLSDPQRYEACARNSRSAALKFISTIRLSAFEEFLSGLH